MKFMKEPKNFESENWNYLVIGYYRGKAIIKNEAARLYFMRCEEEQAPIGTVVSQGKALEPIEKLNQEEQEKINEIYGTKTDD